MTDLGAPPGTAHPRRTRCYRHGVLVEEDFALDRLAAHLADAEAVVWVHLVAGDLDGLQLVADELDLHSLAVEDATSRQERPKFVRYTGHDFLTAYAVQLDLPTGELVTNVVSAFITPGRWSPSPRPTGSTWTRSCGGGATTSR